MKTPMFASIRKYSGAPTLADELLKRQEEIKSVLKTIKGFHSYYLLKTSDEARIHLECATHVASF